MAEKRVQRRLAAILAADVVGYSRMMRENEAGTLAQLKTHRIEVFDPRIAEHNGRIVKTTGDGVLVEFASAVDATECAIKIQRSLARRNEDVPDGHRIELRIGINLGDIVVDGEDIFGDGVNVAARLEGLCEVGEVYVSAVVHDQVESKIEATFDNLGDHTVKNIDKPIRVYRVSFQTSSEMGTAASTKVDQLFDRPAVAVLPFENMSGDPEQEYFSDGITEDIITALSRARWFRVVSRNSAFAYKGTSQDVRQIAKELDVRYVLEGSVRKASNRVRITAQLIEGATDNHLWAEHYDRELEDIFDVQDEITASIAVQIEPELRKAEINRAAVVRPENLSVWDIYQRGMWHVYRKDSPDNGQALDHFRRAVGLDPNFGRAHSGIAGSCFYLVHYGQVEDREKYIDEGMRAARRALELDGNDPVARFTLGGIHYLRRDYDEALAECEHAVRLDPAHAQARITIGRILVDLGKFPEAVEKMTEAIHLCPNEPMLGVLAPYSSGID